MSPGLVFFFNFPLAIPDGFWLHTNFWIVSFSSVENANSIVIRMALKMLIALGSRDILTMFVLLIHEHGMFFYLFVSSSIYFMCSVVSRIYIIYLFG